MDKLRRKLSQSKEIIKRQFDATFGEGFTFQNCTVMGFSDVEKYIQKQREEIANKNGTLQGVFMELNTNAEGKSSKDQTVNAVIKTYYGKDNKYYELSEHFDRISMHGLPEDIAEELSVEDKVVIQIDE